MKRSLVALVVALHALAAQALTPEAKEFMAVTAKLEPVQCEKRKLRREIALAEVQRDHARVRELRARFDALERDPRTARLERRLGELEQRISNGRGGTIDPEDLEAISRQQREAFYRCE